MSLLSELCPLPAIKPAASSASSILSHALRSLISSSLGASAVPSTVKAPSAAPPDMAAPFISGSASTYGPAPVCPKVVMTLQQKTVWCCQHYRGAIAFVVHRLHRN